MARFCSSCGAALPDGANNCPQCGTSARPAASGPAPGAAPAYASSSTGGLADNVAGLLAYVTIIPAIIFLVIEPFNRNRFVRFHSFQCIFTAIAWWVLWIILHVIATIPVFGWLTIFVWPLVGLGGLVLWIILMMKAYQGQMFKLPVIGDIAEKQAGA